MACDNTDKKGDEALEIYPLCSLKSLNYKMKLLDLIFEMIFNRVTLFLSYFNMII